MNTRRFAYIDGVRHAHKGSGTVVPSETETKMAADAPTNTKLFKTARNDACNETSAVITASAPPSELAFSIAMYETAHRDFHYEPFWDEVDERMLLYNGLKTVMDALVNTGVNSASMLDPLLRKWHDRAGTSAVYLETGLNGMPIKQESI